MSIKYNGKTIAGNYKTQIIKDADTVNSGKIRIATQSEIDVGTNNTTAVTPFYLSKGLAQKQDNLTAGEGIKIEDNVISTESTKILTDNQTIIQNEDNTITTVGQKTKSDTIMVSWEGTQEEYEAGLADGTISPEWYCYITDDEKILDLDNYITEDELNNIQFQQTNCIKNMAPRIEYVLQNYSFTMPNGFLTFDKSVVSGFASDKYIVVENPVETIANMEAVFKFTTGSNITTRQYICGQVQNNLTTFQIGIDGSTTNKFEILYTSNGSSWDGAIKATVSSILKPNTTYWVKLNFNSSEGGKGYLSTDGENFNLIASSTTKGLTFNQPMALGDDQLNSPWLGSIDIEQCYIDINNRNFWTGKCAKMTLKKGSRFVIPDGFEDPDTKLIPKFRHKILEDDVTDYIAPILYNESATRSLTIDSDNHIIASALSESLDSSYTGTSNNMVYRKDLNKMEIYNYGTLSPDNNVCFPFMLVQSVVGTNDIISTVSRLFDYKGFIGGTYWVDMNVDMSFADGYNGKINSLDYTTDNVYILNSPVLANSEYYLFLELADGKNILKNQIVMDNVDTFSASVKQPMRQIYKWYNLKNNTYYYKSPYFNNDKPFKIYNCPLDKVYFANNKFIFNQSYKPQQILTNDNVVITTPVRLQTNGNNDIIGTSDFDFKSTKTSYPANHSLTRILNYDINNNWTGSFQHNLNTDGSLRTEIGVRRNVNGADKSGWIGVWALPNGTISTTAPASASTNSIVTTTGISKGSNGYVKLGNGIIIQWGRSGNIANQRSATITLPVAFTSVNFKVVLAQYSGVEGNYSNGFNINSQSASNFVFTSRAGGNAYFNWIAIGY